MRRSIFPVPSVLIAMFGRMAWMGACILAWMSGAPAQGAVSATYAPSALPTANARFLRSTGNAGSTNVLAWQQFKGNVELAATINLGGVINFEDGSDRFASTLIRPAIGNPLGFSISGSEFAIRGMGSFGDPVGPFPSGSFVLSSSSGSTLRNEFRFSGFAFANSPQARLTQVGFTLMGDIYNDMLRDELTVRFSGGGTLTLDSDLKGSVYTQRFFYGAKAPAGEWITSINSNFGGTRIVILDDFGFVAVPEPSMTAFAVIGLMLCMQRRRAVDDSSQALAVGEVPRSSPNGLRRAGGVISDPISPLLER